MYLGVWHNRKTRIFLFLIVHAYHNQEKAKDHYVVHLETAACAVTVIVSAAVVTGFVI